MAQKNLVLIYKLYYNKSTMSYQDLKQAVLNAFNEDRDDILEQVADRLTLRLDELSGLPKEDLLVGIDDTSNKQWLQSKAALKDPGVRKYAAR